MNIAQKKKKKPDKVTEHQGKFGYLDIQNFINHDFLHLRMSMCSSVLGLPSSTNTVISSPSCFYGWFNFLVMCISDGNLKKNLTIQSDFNSECHNVIIKQLPNTFWRAAKFALYRLQDDLFFSSIWPLASFQTSFVTFYTCAGGRVTLAFIRILIRVLQRLVWPREILQRETETERDKRDGEGVKEVYSKCIRKKGTRDSISGRRETEHCQIARTFIRWVMILTISSMEGRCEGSLDQQRVIRISIGLGRFLMRGGRVPEHTNK